MYAKTINFPTILSSLQNRSVANLRVHASKCSFMQEKVYYPGFTIDKDGLHTNNENIEAIKYMKFPESVKGVKALLDTVN